MARSGASIVDSAGFAKVTFRFSIALGSGPHSTATCLCSSCSFLTSHQHAHYHYTEAASAPIYCFATSACLRPSGFQDENKPSDAIFI